MRNSSLGGIGKEDIMSFAHGFFTGLYNKRPKPRLGHSNSCHSPLLSGLGRLGIQRQDSARLMS